MKKRRKETFTESSSSSLSHDNNDVKHSREWEKETKKKTKEKKVFPVHTNRSNDSSKQEGNECVHGVCVVDEMFSACRCCCSCMKNIFLGIRKEEKRDICIKNRWNHRKITNECFTKVGVAHNTFFIVVGAW